MLPRLAGVFPRLTRRRCGLLQSKKYLHLSTVLLKASNHDLDSRNYRYKLDTKKLLKSTQYYIFTACSVGSPL